MELKDTVKLMLSDDWRDRLKAEWLQLMYNIPDDDLQLVINQKLARLEGRL